jgi:hypothetical protein
MKATGNNARSVSAKECDYTVWIKAIHRTFVEVVSQNLRPQQLGIGVSSSLEAKNLIFRMCIEERLATGGGGAVVKDDRINAHNTFCKMSQVFAALEIPNAVLFARISDIQARTNAEVFTRTSEDPS